MSSTAEKPVASSKTTDAANNEFLKAMEKKDTEGLKQAFQVLPKGPTQDHALISADVLRRAIKARGLDLTVEEVKETILYVQTEPKVEGETMAEGQHQITYEQFIKIVNLLEKPTLVDQMTKAYGVLVNGKEQKIVLYGKPGVGKTWMAGKIAGRALRRQEFDVAIWVYLNRRYEGLSLQESIAYQVSVLDKFEKSEAEEELKRRELKKEKDKDKDKDEKEEPKEMKEKKKRDKIEEMIRRALEKKKLLLILDNEGSGMRLDWSQEHDEHGKTRICLKLDSIKLDEILGMDKLDSYKLLVTSKKDRPTGSGDIGLLVRPLTLEESQSLVTRETNGLDKAAEINALAEFFIGKTERLPSEILIIARVVSYFGKSESGLEKLRKDKEVLEEKEGRKVGDILIRGYERLPKSVLIDCYSSETPERHFLHRGGMVNFSELICYWIMEGLLGQFDRIEDAYEEGHCVLMELIHCGLLEKQEGNYVAPNGPRFNFDIHDHDEFIRKFHSGLGITFDMKLGGVALDDGMIITVGKKMSTCLVDGNHIGDKRPARSLFEPKSELEKENQSELEKDNRSEHEKENQRLFDKENLVIFNPTCQHFQLPILKMQNLRLLVLRGCRFLDSIEHNFQWPIDQENPKVLQRSLSLPPHNPTVSPPTKMENRLEKLTVLEISGPSSLNEIPKNLFRNMLNLKTLNMSYLMIQSLPSPFYELTKIEFLILKGCSRLQELKSLGKLKDLQVLDLSGSTSFHKFYDKSLSANNKLRILNLSQTKIKTLPVIRFNRELEFVSVSNCTELQRIRKIENVTTLQIFDISGASQVTEFCDPSIEKLESLAIVDVSRTDIRQVPSHISNPRFLYMRNCHRLERLLPIEDFAKVEVIDLSGSCSLREIREEFFSKMECLRELNLSKTKIKDLPCLSTLRRLILSGCEQFEELKSLSSLQELEFLDLSGCKALKELEDNCFEKMEGLLYLDLSGIPLTRLPSLSKAINLKELKVRDCPKLTELTGIEKLPALEILDHSGTILTRQPSFTNPNHHPRVLGASIDNINHQELLKTLGASSAGISSDKSDSVNHLEDWRRCKWQISNWRGEANENSLGSPVYGIHFLHLLNKYPSLMTNLSRFHFLVYPTEAEAILPDKSSYRTELNLRDIYFKQVYQEELEKCLEIRAFDNYPPLVGCVLEQAQFVFLVDDPFFKSLLDLCVESNIMAMKACWIERCDELEHVLVSMKEEEADKQEEKKKDGTNKQEEDKKEEDTHKKGEKKKEEDANKQEEKKEDNTQKQEETNKEEDTHKQEEKKEEDANKQEEKKKEEDANKQEEKKEEDTQKQEETKKEEDANKQEEKKEEEDDNKQEENTQKQEEENKKEDTQKQEEKKKEEEANKQDEKKEENSHKQEEKKNPSDIFEKMETLWISDSKNLRIILNGDIESISFKSIKYLYLEYCPQITTICSSSLQLESLEILYVRYCQIMDTLFTDDSAQLNKLTELQLWGLQKLKRIACKAPRLRTLRVGECPLLEHVIDASNEQQEVEGHENLEILHIKYCDKVKTVCKEDRPPPYFSKLRELEMWGLPEVQEIAFRGPSLQCLRVGECCSLQHIVGSTSNIDKTVEVKHCDKLKTVFGDLGLDLGTVTKMELLSLPELEDVGGAQLRRPSSKENRIVWGCPKLCGGSHS